MTNAGTRHPLDCCGAERGRSQLIPPQSLCISPGKAVYVLYIDVVCINYNAFDAAVMAVMAALRNSTSRARASSRAPADPETG